MERKKILFIVSPIKSHFIPSFYLAKLLSSTADIYYTVFENSTAELVTNQGFNTIMNNSNRFGIGTERSAIDYHGNRVSIWTHIKSFICNKIYTERKADLTRIVDELNPYAIFIDTFSSTDFAVLYSYRLSIRFLFFNPMLSTYEVGDFPLISDEEWDRAKQRNTTMLSLVWRNKILHVGMNAWIQFQRVYRKNQMAKDHPLSLDNPFVYSFKNVPEFVLAPVELELSDKIRKEDQYYLGLCVAPSRKDIQVDEDFDRSFSEIRSKAIGEGHKLLYCSFGSYFHSLEEFKTITSFILALIEALKAEPAIQVVLAVNEEIKEVLYEVSEIPEQFYVFKKVRQLEVLKSADAFITHGGLGSLKEAIFYKVPVLVYPLDKEWDQAGNGLKAEYHGIGLRGDILNDEPEMIHAKVKELLDTDKFKVRIGEFSDQLKANYPASSEMELIEKLLKMKVTSPVEEEVVI
jgi:UDP:flavonoid glycosyltransferase YjiC (YdhE family)